MREIEDLIYKMMHCEHCFVKKLQEEDFELTEIIQGGANRICPDCGSLLWIKINKRCEIEEIRNVTLFNMYEIYFDLINSI